MIRRLMACLTVLVSISACAQQHSSALPPNLLRKYSLESVGQRNFQGRFRLVSLVDEQQIGDDAQAEIEETTVKLDDQASVVYLESLARHISDNSDIRGRKLRFMILRDDSFNAMSLSNGTIYVNSGLLLQLEDEAELAGIIGHEMGHIAAHHAARGTLRRGVMGAASLALAMAPGTVAQAALPITQFADGALESKFSRNDEREADLLGLEYAYLAGYDPEALVSVFERFSVSTVKQGRISKLNATHPEALERIAYARRVISALMPAREQTLVDSSDFQMMQERIAALTHPEVLQKPVLVKKQN